MRRDPSPEAYDALPYTLHLDGKAGTTRTIVKGDSVSGRLNLPTQHTDVGRKHMGDVSGPARGLPQGR